MRKILDYPVWQEMLVELLGMDEAIISSLSRNLGVTYSHVSKCIKALESKGWIKTSVMGRSRSIELTPDGAFMARHLAIIKVGK
jgi:DNA-binding MarR family transcriptional regulator